MKLNIQTAIFHNQIKKTQKENTHLLELRLVFFKNPNLE